MGPFLRHFQLPRTHRALGALARGFTLVEMLVVTAIIIIVAGVIFAGQGNFNSSVLLSSTAYDLALTLHDAQTYGLSTRASTGIANAGYGLHFASSASKSYALFVDSSPLAGKSTSCHPLPANGATAPDAYPGDCIYTSKDTKIATYTLGNNMSIGDFCAYNGTWICTSSGLTSLDVIFLRPNALPFISENGAYTATVPVTAACITIASPKGTMKYVSIAASGQISADAPSCP